MRVSIATLAIFAPMAMYCAASALGESDSSSPSDRLRITNSYADGEEEREWYENQYESIRSAKKIKEAILSCKDFYAIENPLEWKSSYVVLDRILEAIADAKPRKPQLADLSPMLVQVAVDCVDLDEEYGGKLKHAGGYNFYQSAIEKTSTSNWAISNWAVVLTHYRNNFVDVFLGGKQYVPNNAQAIQIAFQNLVESIGYIGGRDFEREEVKPGEIIEDMTPVQVQLLGRLMVAFSEEVEEWD